MCSNRQMIHPLLGERTEPRASVQRFFRAHGEFRVPSDPLTGHEPERVVIPENVQLIVTADCGSLSPQRGEGSRVKGETAQVVGNQYSNFQVHGEETGEGGQSYANGAHILTRGSNLSCNRRDGAKICFLPMNPRHLLSTTDVISPLTPALSPLKGEGELCAVFWQCFVTQIGSRDQCANFVSRKSLPMNNLPAGQPAIQAP